MKILSREHFKGGTVSNSIFHCGLMFIGIIILQAWPNEGISQSDTMVYEPVGCFNDKKDPRALPRFVKRYSVNETDLANSLASIIQKCATEAHKKGFWYFGVEYRHECWSGVNGNMTYNIHGPTGKCLLNYGVGGAWTIFVYRFVEVNGCWSQWSSWNPCSVTCGRGHRIRTRTCSNPAPKWNGKDCPGTNIYTESCNLHQCKDTKVLPPYEPVGCFKDKSYPRALPRLIKIYHVNQTGLAKSLAAIIQKCATKVYKKGFRYFGVEYRDECWSGLNGSMTYNRHGRSDNCLWNYYVGDVWTIFVYRFVEGKLPVDHFTGNLALWQEV
ncbi:uncharacterized protein LOC110055071 [Orbicella faveolata]|uniref:uncharacterized protein LOC110055071 n=1 Tax=Orbicella faveolata TaxID=48498 RepID=UPI0009E3307F|nr:uncharacterized protein LOC110055071 [Orbicella faveolata]